MHEGEECPSPSGTMVSLSTTHQERNMIKTRNAHDFVCLLHRGEGEGKEEKFNHIKLPQ